MFKLIFSEKNIPIIFPIVFFICIIFIGSVILHFSENGNISALSWTDSIFTSTSAACVTGLIVFDTGSYFSLPGRIIILCLMQIGGLGIMTFTSLSIYLWQHRAAEQLADRIDLPRIIQRLPFDSEMIIREISINKLAMKTLREIDLSNRYNCRFIAIKKHMIQATVIYQRRMMFSKKEILLLSLV